MSPEEMKKAWPDVEKNLQEGDILLFHRNKGLLYRAIRKTAKSYWDHAALVFMSKDKLPVGGPLIVEADLNGIEIHQMKRYNDRFDEYAIGVLRYPKLTEKQKEEIVMGFILNNLDVTYDYGRAIGYAIGPLVKKISVRLWAKMFKSVTDQQKFICTTFVHKAFHDLSQHRKVGGFVETHEHDIEKLEEEEFILPGDIAKEPIFEWVFNQHD